MQPYYIVLYMARRAAPSCGRNASLIVRPAGPFPLSRKKERRVAVVVYLVVVYSTMYSIPRGAGPYYYIVLN